MSSASSPPRALVIAAGLARVWGVLQAVVVLALLVPVLAHGRYVMQGLLLAAAALPVSGAYLYAAWGLRKCGRRAGWTALGLAGLLIVSSLVARLPIAVIAVPLNAALAGLVVWKRAALTAP